MVPTSRLVKAAALLFIAAPRTVLGFAPRTRAYSRSVTSMMAIVDEVKDEMIKSMKAKDQVTLNTVRLIRSSFANAQIELKTDKLSDDQAITALKKMAKMRKESITMFAENGAADRAADEQAELEVIERWLPEAVSEDTVREWVQDAIAEAGPDNMGKIMGALMKKHRSEVDGGVAQKIMKEELAKLK
mmetsp:Transcript_16340/g.21386  ORF Transcript_16340/g.21386 Transcript_16340/m.21386 type:complete len:188 (-) Transcript_16340:227-790(-)|eukprot:CAMPEP_0198140342 /NCGR_PEP_ID=MMETSP1443-20131203/3522_1 /TAXON_ID=186043 /ORGANISM="Entomoneis sp., Strain CCMP2396" /LENGTH=187 /DNA_ID=CAMNT_0043802733 /DNA_START=56 /DNA_END=619 /DNA_ORIENTATION=-